jgi:hypothetical protein
MCWKTNRGVKEAQQLKGEEPPSLDGRPVLFVDVDGVISLFGFDPSDRPKGSFHSIDGILLWATGWEEKANEYLPRLLGMPGALPVLTFDGRAVFGTAHWKLEAMDAFAGDRPAAWIDDSLDERCTNWAHRRRAPTLLVETDSAVGVTDEHVERLLRWADEVGAGGHR